MAMTTSIVRKVAQDHLYNAMYDAGKALKVFPKGPNGLTSDTVKNSPEYRAAKSNYDQAFAAVRQFNTSH